ncbi:hypothetical protein LOZ64_005577 [Ophidiomyces ophidiicola]|nr:hypothetical protein LOZ64_005577 [Ophidiomyces ophidiicola]
MSVTILKSEYDTLVPRVRCVVPGRPFTGQFLNRYFLWWLETLKHALIQGGIPQSSLDTLIYSSENSFGVPQEDTSPTLNSDAQLKPSVHEKYDDPGHLTVGPYRPSYHCPKTPVIRTPVRHSSVDPDDISVPSDGKLDSPYSAEGPVKYRGNGPDNRTVTLKGIPDRATYADVIGAIRGGRVLDIFFRSRDHMASISFAESTAAQQFMAHTKRYRFYILDKPVDVSWADRPFILSQYIATQISNGASRNILIRGVHPNVTEAQIREDMKHIHNLVIISVTFSQRNAYISANSVQKASYARNCMRSRMPYKMMRIEFYPDECAGSLRRSPPLRRKEASPQAKKLNPMANRFEILHLDESDDDSDGLDRLKIYDSVPQGARWSDIAITV